MAKTNATCMLASRYRAYLGLDRWRGCGRWTMDNGRVPTGDKGARESSNVHGVDTKYICG